MGIFFLHFAAHLGSSYFLCDQAHALLNRSKLSYFSSILWSVLIAFLIGVVYKCGEAYSAGHFTSLFAAMTYNATGIIIAVNKFLADPRAKK